MQVVNDVCCGMQVVKEQETETETASFCDGLLRLIQVKPVFYCPSLLLSQLHSLSAALRCIRCLPRSTPRFRS